MDPNDESEGGDGRIPGWGFVPDTPSEHAEPTGEDGDGPGLPPLGPDPDEEPSGPAIPGWGPGVSSGPAPMESPFPDVPPTEWPDRIVAPTVHREAVRQARSPVPIVAAASIMTVLLLSIILLVLQSDDSGDEAAVTTAPPTTVAAVDPVPVADVLPGLITFVEEARASSFTTEPVPNLAPDEDYEEIIDGWLLRDRAAIDDRELLLRGLGVMDADEDYFEMVRAWHVKASDAAYDPVSGVVLVRGDEVTPGGRVELARALAAALDDEAYELDRTLEPGVDPEVALAFRLSAERVAQVVGEEYVASLDPDERAAAERELAGKREHWEAAVPEGVATIEFASERTAEMVAAQWEEGPAAVDQMIVDPPTTIEQAFSAAAFADRRIPFAVGVSAGAAAPQVEARFTPLDLNSMGIDPLPDELWGGGRYSRSTSEDGRGCVQFRVLGADDEATRALHVQVALWADRTNAIVRRVFDQQAGREVVDGLRCE